jgi:hypothetical protein
MTRDGATTFDANALWAKSTAFVHRGLRARDNGAELELHLWCALALGRAQYLVPLFLICSETLACAEASEPGRADSGRPVKDAGGRTPDAGTERDGGSHNPDAASEGDAMVRDSGADGTSGNDCEVVTYVELVCQGFWSPTLPRCERADGVIEDDSCLREVVNEVCPGFGASTQFAEIEAEDDVIVLRTRMLTCPGELRVTSVERCEECARVEFHGVPDIGLGDGCSSSCDMVPSWVALVKVPTGLSICAEEAAPPCLRP